MSYNNIGLATVRGSGTNGYVQRNFAVVRRQKNDTQYRAEDDFGKTERLYNRKPNADLLEHERKRAIELKCVELQDSMEEQGYPDDEVEEKVSELRRKLLDEADTKSNKMNKYCRMRVH